MKAAVLIVVCSLSGYGWADDIDDAYKAQRGSSQVRTEVDSAVQRQSAEAGQRVAERALAIERQRAEEMRQSSAPRATSSVDDSARSKAPQKREGSFAFTCTYKCTNQKLLGADKTTLVVRVRASSKEAARDETFWHGTKTCYEQTQRVYDTSSASCRRE